MKSGTNFTDRNRIKEWHAEGASAEVISRNLKIKVEVVQGMMDSLDGKGKSKPKAKPKAKPAPAPDSTSVGDEIPPNSIEV